MKSNAEYWKERFELLEKSQHAKAIDCYENIENHYRRAQKEVEKQISTWYQRFAKNNGITMVEAKRALNAKELEELRWDVNEYIKHGKSDNLSEEWIKKLENASARHHISRLEALKLQLQQATEVLFGNQLDDIDRTVRDVYKSGYLHTAFEIQKGIGVGWDIASLDDRKISKIINNPWAADGRNFSERIWNNSQKLIEEMNKTITQNIILGQDPQKAIDKIAKRLNVSKVNAGRLVMTEEAFFSSTSQKDCFEDLDVEQFEIVATLDSRTSEICQDMDGQHFKMSDWEVGVTAPPFHVNCRSTTVPYFDDEFDAVGERAARGEDGKTYYVPGNMTYKEWEKSFVDGDKSQEKKETDKKKTTDYLIRSHIPGQNITKERKMVNEVVAIMPTKVQQALKNTVIDVGKDGASQYDYIHDILYVAQGAEKDAIIHEIGHMVENKILDETKVRNLLNGLIGEVDITQIRQEIFYDSNMNPREVFLIENSAFVTEYQGRVYCETIWDAFDENGDFRSDLLWEFSSEGFREFVENPENLKLKNPKLYDLIEEALNE